MLEIKKNIKDKFLFIEIINQDSLDLINRVFDTHYSKKQVRESVRIQLAPKSFDFYKKLMEQKPKAGANI